MARRRRRSATIFIMFIQSKIRPRFTIRSLLIVILLVACFLAVWRTRPSPTLSVQLTSRGIALVDGDKVSMYRLSDVLRREGERRQFWFVRGALIIKADRSTKFGMIKNVVDLGKKAGFARLTVHVSKTRKQ